MLEKYTKVRPKDKNHKLYGQIVEHYGVEAGVGSCGKVIRDTRYFYGRRMI